MLREDSLIVHKLFTPLVKDRSVGGLTWLRNNFSNNPGLLDGYTDTASVEDFRECLKDGLGGSTAEDDEAYRLIAEIADTLGIEPEVETTSDDEISQGNGSEEENSDSG